MIKHAAHRETPDGRLHVVLGAMLIASRASQTRRTGNGAHHRAGPVTASGRAPV